MYRVTVTRIVTIQALWGTLAVNRLIADGYDPAVADYAIRQYLSSFGYMPVQTEEIVYMQEYAESEGARAIGDYIARVNENANDYITLEWIA